MQDRLHELDFDPRRHNLPERKLGLERKSRGVADGLFYEKSCIVVDLSFEHLFALPQLRDIVKVVLHVSSALEHHAVDRYRLVYGRNGHLVLCEYQNAEELHKHDVQTFPLSIGPLVTIANCGDRSDYEVGLVNEHLEDKLLDLLQ